jgi:signal transduction histidine kinase
MIFGLTGIPLYLFDFFTMLFIPLTLNLEKRRPDFTPIRFGLETIVLFLFRESIRSVLGDYYSIFLDAIICLLVFALYAYLLFFNSPLIAFLYATMMYFAGTSAAITSIFLVRLLEVKLFMDYYLLSIAISSILIDVAMFVIFRYFKPMFSSYFLTSIPVLALLSAIVLCEIVLLPQEFTKQQSLYNDELDNMNIIIVINILGLFIFFLYISAAGYTKKLTDATISKEFAMLETLFSRNFKATYNEMLMLRHDYLNHLITLDLLVKERRFAEVNDYIQKLNAQYLEVQTVVQSGNFVVDAIVNSKMSEAKKRGIQVKVTALVPDSLKMKSPDIISMLGNLLDNAIESTERIQKKEPEREIAPVVVDIRVVAKQLIIQISNEAKEPPRKIHGRYRSSKSRRRPGIGLQTIDRIVHHYNGNVFREFKGGTFTTKILLPISF